MPEGYVVFDIETTGLNPWYGDRITCICAKDNEGHWFSENIEHFEPLNVEQSIPCDLNEIRLIIMFIIWLRDRKGKLLVTKNGKGFDVPFILSRYCTISINQPLNLELCLKVLINTEHFDLQEITSKAISLKDMAKLFSCEPKNGDGISAIKLWEEKRYDELKSYCEQDVRVTEQVYLRYKSLQEVQ